LEYNLYVNSGVKIIDGERLDTSIRILVVDDFAPFRQFVASILQRQPELQIIGEVSDGLEAVQKAQELQPDLVLLDIGLPKLNGIEAGRRISKLSPHSKILFISQEISIDVVQGALAIGASGYVPKVDAGSELLTAVNAVLRGEHFVGSRFVGHDFTGHSVAETLALEQHAEIVRHEVGFYANDRFFLAHPARFVEAALRAGNAAIVVATKTHRNNLLSKLRACGLDIGASIEQGRYISVDAADAISAFMFNGTLDSAQYVKLLGDLIVTAAGAAKSSPPRVAIFGEGVNILCAQGNVESAIQVEKLCNQLVQTYDIDILCAYSRDSIPGGMENNIFQKICAEHSAVIAQ
jgi:DNA-binding NarL/FixJ family response regulator